MQVDLAQAVTRLKNGEVVAIPTETVYGLAADARNEAAIAQIYAIKERPANNPLIVHIADMAQVDDWASEFPPLAKRLAEAFWPGPFTLVLPAKGDVPASLRAGEPTVALRMPAHPITQQVLQESGLALAAPSANKYTQLSPTTAAHVAQGLGESVAVLDGGACDVGIESTIVSVADDQWRLLRPGMIAETTIEQAAGKPALQDQIDLPKAPGQHLLHYSPKTPIHLFESRAALLAFAKQQVGGAILLIGDDASDTPPSHTVYCLPSDPAVVGEKLYDTLHQMDALNQPFLLIELPPKQAVWMAIHDRLSRAAHKFD